jgi:hypothetical protein
LLAAQKDILRQMQQLQACLPAQDASDGQDDDLPPPPPLPPEQRPEPSSDYGDF